MKVLWLGNHPCSPEQKSDLAEMLGSDVNITELDDDGKALWASVPADADLSAVASHFAKVVHDIEPIHACYDAVVVMGELSICLITCQSCAMNRLPVYTPTTRRESTETVMPDGAVRKTAVFRHVRFRRLV